MNEFTCTTAADSPLPRDMSQRMQFESRLDQMQSTSLPTYASFFQFVEHQVQHVPELVGHVRKQAKELLAVTRAMCPVQCGQSSLESASMAIINIFYDSIHVSFEQSLTSQVQQQLQHVFGTSIRRPLMLRSQECAKQIMELVDVESLHNFFQTNAIKNPSSSGHNSNDVASREIPINGDCDSLDKIANLLSFNIKSTSTETKKTSSPTLNCLTTSAYRDLEEPSASRSKQTHIECKSIDWLRNELLNAFEGKTRDIRTDDLLQMILTLLNEGDEEQIQNELISLLGFERIELIGEIIQNKDYIQQPKASAVPSKSNVINESSATILAPKNPSKRNQTIFRNNPKTNPGILPSITFVSAEEKRIGKLMNRFEKKAAKERKKLKQLLTNDDDNGLEQDQIDDHVEQLTMEQQQRLQTLMGEGQVTFDLPAEPLPYVFDLNAEIRRTAAFASNQKLLLPEGTEVNDARTHKQIEVPAPPQLPTNVQDKFDLVLINQLSSIGQKMFAGFSSLNQIQSIVYETACHSNENMLICAPTGAGKTNVALLTMLQEIERHAASDGRIDRDEFKIIYVAPMKALVAEMADNFAQRLRPLRLNVRECSGDMQLTRQELADTQVIVTTPEKWDVITRKALDYAELLESVRLLIIDEIHLLQTSRGPVLEAIVTRTHRHVQTTQKPCRLVGLSATLPNYLDVAHFLHVNSKLGLFVFDGRFRPVPLTQCFVGCKALDKHQLARDMDLVCFEKVKKFIQQGHQCMVFVHSRNATHKTAVTLKSEVSQNGMQDLFAKPLNRDDQRQIDSVRNSSLRELLLAGFGTHHAGLLRHDRNVVEQLFKEGKIQVLCCTATLAWGVNLPARAVIIKGTEVYDTERGGVVDLDVLDVIQIFGRAGRPQYDSEGHGTIITTHDKLALYLRMLTAQCPVESQFLNHLADNLNAEIASGQLANLDEAVDWLSQTFLFVRLQRNPKAYGISMQTLQNDPDLYHVRRRMVRECVQALDQAKLIRFDERSETVDATELGRIASHFYIKYETIERFNERLDDNMMEEQVLEMLCQATEFEQLKVRDDEMEELTDLGRTCCQLKVKLSADHIPGKVNVLLQTYLSQVQPKSHSLASDEFFVEQTLRRIARGLFMYAIKRGLPQLSRRLLTIGKMLELQQWDTQTALRQFGKQLQPEELRKIERAKLPIFALKSDHDYTHRDLAQLLRLNDQRALKIKHLAHCIPSLQIQAHIRPITRSVLQVQLDVIPDFKWDDQVHGKSVQHFWIWLEDADNGHMFHYEHMQLNRQQVQKATPKVLLFTIPIVDADHMPQHYVVHYDSDKWLAADNDVVISCESLQLPEKYLPYTTLLDLHPLPVTALQNYRFESVYKFTHFNPIQTQVFHTLYHTDTNVLLGAPTGSGKTICAEIALFRVFGNQPSAKVVYIGPLKALVRERVIDWQAKFGRGSSLSKRVIELTGDVAPDLKSMQLANVIVTTPEKWDSISRSWAGRKYVKQVRLIIIDEIHLLNEDRGPVLEAIVSRTNFISQATGQSIRIVGMSTAVANAQDLAGWLRIDRVGLYNFKPSVRPVPLEVHIAGFPGEHYCPRMAAMNKSVFRAIQQHSPDKSVLVFVSSRRQTRLTALDLIALVAQQNVHEWLHMSQEEMAALIDGQVKDSNLKLTLAFGIGMHHAGLDESDRALCEQLFANNRIQLLVCTSTLAWGVNLPAHMVVVKGTEYYDGKQHKYVDFPITDVLQMIGRAGRPQFDRFGKAIVLVHDVKKEYYKKFLYEPFPVESNLMHVLDDHLNAEIVANTIRSQVDCIRYLSWTFLYRRMLKNPSYYGLEGTDEQQVCRYMSTLIDTSLDRLQQSGCVELVDKDEQSLRSLPLGRIASYYYLRHQTVGMFCQRLGNSDLWTEQQLLMLSTQANEFDELPVRHNEDILNEQLARICRYKLTEDQSCDDPHTKAYLLLQAHFDQLDLPNSDYLTDTKLVMDQYIRVVQALVDIAALKGLTMVCIRCVRLIQMVIQGIWFDRPSVLQMPKLTAKVDLLRFLDKAQLPNDLNALISLQQQTSNEKMNPLVSALNCKGRLSFDQAKKLGSLIQKYPPMERVQLQVTNLNNYKRYDLTKSTLEMMAKCYRQSTDEKENETVLNELPLLLTNTDHTISIRLPGHGEGGRCNAAITPKYQKTKDEAWFIVLHDTRKNDLVAIKRVNNLCNNGYVVFTTSAFNGLCEYRLHLISDCYVGFEHSCDLRFRLADKLEDESQRFAN